MNTLQLISLGFVHGAAMGISIIIAAAILVSLAMAVIKRTDHDLYE